MTASDTVGTFFSYQAIGLQNLIDATRDVIGHSLTKGIEAEDALADLLAACSELSVDEAAIRARA
jgi:hypothetical protein